MTNPPPDPQLAALQTMLNQLDATVKDLTRAIQGDTATGASSIREMLRTQDERFAREIKNMKDEFKSEADSYEDRIEILEKKNDAQENMLKGVTLLIKWLGAGSLTGLLGLIAILSGVLGGHK